MSRNTLYWSLGTAALILVCAAVAIVAVSKSSTNNGQPATVPAAQHGTTQSSPPTATVVTTETTTQTAQPPPQSSGGESGTPAPSGSFSACDQNISVTQDASCPFAENVFYEAWNQYNAGVWSAQGGSSVDFEAYSPVTGRDYSISCLNSAGSAGNIVCTNDNDPGAQIMFPASSIWAYTQSEADAYAASANLAP